jgi:acyl-coenzyme A synthetase/AMP-(fatty) acid ligase
MSTGFPLIRHSRPAALLGLYQQRPISVEQFLSDVTGLASILPPRRHVINLCGDRYRFTVALAAALMREQVSLMPPSDVPAVLSALVARFPDLYCLHDGAAPAVRLPVAAYPEEPFPATRPTTVPSFPADQPAVMLFTSGSSGEPTPHQKSWGSLVRSALAAGTGLGISRLPNATVIGTVPQQHSYGLESTVLLPLQHGLTLHGARPFYPGDIAACIAAAPHPRILVTTPIHLRAMLADADSVPAVDLLISATAPLEAQLAADAERRFGAPLLEIYGCSEAGQLAVRHTVESAEWRCLETVVLRQDATGTSASGPAVEGEVLLNDIIELTSSDRFLLHGRTADLVNIAGKRTSLTHLNYHLNSIAGVTDGAFIMPEESGDGVTRLMAFAVAPGISTEILLAALRQRIDAAFLPRPLLLVDKLPRNLLGKLPREAALRLAANKKD